MDTPTSANTRPNPAITAARTAERDSSSTVRLLRKGLAPRLRAVAPLIAALKDEDAYVRKAAAKALEAITGEPLGTDGERWQQDGRSTRNRKHRRAHESTEAELLTPRG